MLYEVKKLLENNEFEKARTTLLKLLEKQPDHPELNFYCASAHDALGIEREAIPYYEQALVCQIEGELREATYVQLGSSYRCIGEYEKAKQVFKKGIKEFPTNLALQTFIALTLYNLEEHSEAVSTLLKVCIHSSDDKWIFKYRTALQYYGEHLDETW
ncbi:MAG: tetratricopeptide repeat protein [Bacillus sp. (in: Bacteria)]|nr:tetratricopeptide repeat protein [Bacillus sp. (in: firmicutes)]